MALDPKNLGAVTWVIYACYLLPFDRRWRCRRAAGSRSSAYSFWSFIVITLVAACTLRRHLREGVRLGDAADDVGGVRDPEVLQGAAADSLYPS